MRESATASPSSLCSSRRAELGSCGRRHPRARGTTLPDTRCMFGTARVYLQPRLAKSGHSHTTTSATTHTGTSHQHTSAPEPRDSEEAARHRCMSFHVQKYKRIIRHTAQYAGRNRPGPCHPSSTFRHTLPTLLCVSHHCSSPSSSAGLRCPSLTRCFHHLLSGCDGSFVSSPSSAGSSSSSSGS